MNEETLKTENEKLKKELAYYKKKELMREFGWNEEEWNMLEEICDEITESKLKNLKTLMERKELRKMAMTA